MPDATVIPSDPADPAKPGNQTSEFSLTKLFVIFASLVALFIPLLAAFSQAFTQAYDLFPGARWLGACAAAMAALLGVAQTVGKYTGGRADIKAAQIAGAATVQAARVAAAVPK